jgi:formylglycine-generating enzyme
MRNFDIRFPGLEKSLTMVFVKGTGGRPYSFGDFEKVDISIDDFFISKFPVTQQLWCYITGNYPSIFKGPERPVENVSFEDITQKDGFLNRFSVAAGTILTIGSKFTFRLPSESEWEYAARGGQHWTDGFQFSGGNNMNDIGWYDQNSGEYTDPEILARLKNQEKGTSTQEVGQKLPNQLGIFDMCGNTWEWCEDYFQHNIYKIPRDGTPYSAQASDRVLRGGCHHNMAIHCTVSKRYGIYQGAKDECIGFRIPAAAGLA